MKHVLFMASLLFVGGCGTVELEDRGPEIPVSKIHVIDDDYDFDILWRDGAIVSVGGFKFGSRQSPFFDCTECVLRLEKPIRDFTCVHLGYVSNRLHTVTFLTDPDRFDVSSPEGVGELNASIERERRHFKSWTKESDWSEERWKTSYVWSAANNGINIFVPGKFILWQPTKRWWWEKVVDLFGDGGDEYLSHIDYFSSGMLAVCFADWRIKPNVGEGWRGVHSPKAIRGIGAEEYFFAYFEKNRPPLAGMEIITPWWRLELGRGESGNKAVISGDAAVAREQLKEFLSSLK